MSGHHPSPHLCVARCRLRFSLLNLSPGTKMTSHDTQLDIVTKWPKPQKTAEREKGK